MMEWISQFLTSEEVSSTMENFSNERLIEYITSPVGIGVYVFVLFLMILMKQRLVFLILVAVMSGIFIARYTLTDTSGPNTTIFVFLGATVVLSAYIIYTGFIRDE